MSEVFVVYWESAFIKSAHELCIVILQYFGCYVPFNSALPVIIIAISSVVVYNSHEEVNTTVVILSLEIQTKQNAQNKAPLETDAPGDHRVRN